MLSEGQDVSVLLARVWLLSEGHRCSLQVKTLTGSCGSSSLEATLLTYKILVTEVFAYVAASNTVWSSRKKTHLSFDRTKDCGGFPQPCCANVCKLCFFGVLSLQIPGPPRGLPSSFDFCEGVLPLPVNLKDKPRPSSQRWQWRVLDFLGFTFISNFLLFPFLFLDSCSSSYRLPTPV